MKASGFGSRSTAPGALPLAYGLWGTGTKQKRGEQEMDAERFGHGSGAVMSASPPRAQIELFDDRSIHCHGDRWTVLAFCRDYDWHFRTWRDTLRHYCFDEV